MSQIAIPNRVYDVRPTDVISPLLTAIADTVLINITSGIGILYTLAVRVSANVTGGPVVRIDITVDGATLQSLSLYNGGTTWDATSLGVWRHIGSGDFANDVLIIPLRVEFRSSLRISLNVITAATAGGVRLASIRGVAL